MKRWRPLYIPLFIQDILNGCQDLSCEEFGALMRLLLEIYANMGPIDYNDQVLARRLNFRPHKARKLVDGLIEKRKFYLTAGRKISNHRAEAEIEKIVRKSVQNALNASSNAGKSKFDGTKPNNNNDPALRPLSGRIHNLETRNNIFPSDASALPPEEDLHRPSPNPRSASQLQALLQNRRLGSRLTAPAQRNLSENEAIRPDGGYSADGTDGQVATTVTDQKPEGNLQVAAAAGAGNGSSVAGRTSVASHSHSDPNETDIL